MPANPTPQQTAAWIDRILPALMANNDVDLLGKLSEIRKSLGPKRQTVRTVRNVSGTAVGFDPKKTYSVQVDENGLPVGQPLEEGIAPGTQAGLTLRTEMTPAAAARAEQAIVGRFDAQSKDYAKAHEAWQQVSQVLQRAQRGQPSPDDLVQLLDGISRLNNPGATVRTGTVNLQLEKIGSLAQKLRMRMAQAGTGVWPKDIVEGIGAAAQTIANEHAKQYNDLRQRAIKRGEHAGLPYLDDVLPDVWGDGGTIPVSDTRPPLSSFNFGGRR